MNEFNYINSKIPKSDPINEIELFETYGYIGQHFTERLIRIEKILMKKAEVHQKSFFCHNDLNPSNILINPKTLEIEAIIDLD